MGRYTHLFLIAVFALPLDPPGRLGSVAPDANAAPWPGLLDRGGDRENQDAAVAP